MIVEYFVMYENGEPVAVASGPPQVIQAYLTVGFQQCDEETHDKVRHMIERKVIDEAAARRGEGE